MNVRAVGSIEDELKKKEAYLRRDKEETPTCWIVAGPNGAGKSTLAGRYLPDVPYLNADNIARENGLDAATVAGFVAAGRILHERLDDVVRERSSFALETTLSGRGDLKMVRNLRSNGWRVELHYVFIPSSEFSVQRVHERVMHGGHDVPVAEVQRRYDRSVGNVLAYSDLCDYTACYDNSTAFPHYVFTRNGTEMPRVYDSCVYNRVAHGDPLPARSASSAVPGELMDVFARAVAEKFRALKDEKVVVADERRMPVSRSADELLDLLNMALPGLGVVEGCCSLDDPSFADFRSPRGVVFDGRYVRDVKSWREAYEVLLTKLDDLCPEKFDSLPTLDFFRHHFVEVCQGRRYAGYYTERFGTHDNVRAKEISGKAAFAKSTQVVHRLLEYFRIAPNRVALRHVED